MSDGITKKGYYAISGIASLYAVVIILFLMTPSPNIYNYLLRFFALTGFFGITIAATMTPFMKEIYQEFGKPFIKIHHLFASIGIAGATLHPIVLAIQIADLTVFIPAFSTWYQFWFLAGRPALILIYIAVVTVLLRNKIPKYWRAFHSLMYVVIVFVYVHAYLGGSDFDNIGILIIFTLLFIASMGAFFYKRIPIKFTSSS